MSRKSTILILAGTALVAIAAGVTFAVLQPPSQDSSSISTNPQPSGLPASPAPSPTPSPSGTEKPSTFSTGTTPTAPTAPPSDGEQSAPSRELLSCKITMAIVNDPEPPLNVRSAPTNEKANVVDQLENGTFLSVIKEQNGWLQITEPTKGWVAKSRTSHGCNQKVERVNFGKGEQASRITDRFIGTGSHQYLFQAREGQSMTITVQDGPFPLVTGPNGQTLVAGPDDQRRQWTGVLPATGDYTVQLDSNFRGYPYGFTVEIR